MSQSMHVIGIKPPDETWKKMYAVYDACIKAVVAVPPEVQAFFNFGTPDQAGVEVDLFENSKCALHYRTENQDGWEITVAKIPKDVKLIRFLVSY